MGFLNRRKPNEWFSRGKIDVPFFALVIVLLSIGLVMMFSASYVNALYDSSGSVGNDAFYYIKRQLLFAVLGLIAMHVISHINFEVFRDFSSLIFAISILLLIYVLINPSIIPGKEEFKRWIRVPLIGTFQPSEVAKLGLIMFLSFSMEKEQMKVENQSKMVLPYGAITAAVCLLVILENHLSGTILILSIGVVMCFLGGIKINWFVGAIAIAFPLVLLVVSNPDILPGYAAQRITMWLDILKDRVSDSDKVGGAWQSIQALYAIGSGGLFGLGFGNSRQKHLYLPEPQNDFIFAVVCEELGYIRAMLIILLFILLVWRGFKIATSCKSKYAALLAMGISFQVGLQAVLNIAVVTSTVPNTGISLPFFSYGGTSLVMLLSEMGMVLSISRSSRNYAGK